MKPLVILDFDGVIRDTRLASFVGTKAALSAVGLKTRFSIDENWRMRGFKEFNPRLNALKAAYSISVSGKKLGSLLKNSPESILAIEKKYPVSPHVFKKLDEVNRKVALGLMISRPFCRGGRVGLRRLAKTSRLAVVTDARRKVVRDWLDKNGALGFFEALLCNEDVPELKPSPKGITAVLKRLRAAPGRSFYIGDTESDVVAAKAAGVIPIGLECGMASRKMLEQAGAFKVFKDLSDFAEWFSGMFK